MALLKQRRTRTDDKAAPTWDDILEGARDDAILYRTLAEAHIVGREAALLRAVLFLAEERRQRIAEDCDRAMRQAPGPIMVIIGKC